MTEEYTEGQLCTVWEPRVALAFTEENGDEWFRGAYVSAKVDFVTPTHVAVSRLSGFKAMTIHPIDDLDVMPIQSALRETLDFIGVSV